ncbi:glycosyltransferase family 39 protein [Echinicola sp. 20G]|uniref:ArnT family glycosyltransferase n=1 Tax=Echinicola sp. 20G TaxID=2781961 RepID=UPI00190FCECF|nr:glycosyltransferase family 39 protein [Echinicola sp. 20G]
MEIVLNRKKYVEWALLLLSLILHFSNISGLSIYALDEAKNATAAIEMMQNKDWIIPTFNGEYRFDKPPLHYYFFILSYQVFGISEFSARFFPALFGFLTTYITYRFTKRNLGFKAGILSLLVLASSLHWYIQFHMAVPDPFLIFFMTSGLMLFYEWSKSGFRSRKYMLAIYASLALATLSKGPVGVVLPVLAMLIYSLSVNLLNAKRLVRIFHPGGLFLFFLMALPWYILVATKTNGLWVEEFFFKHNLGRFSAPMEGHGGGFWLTWIYVIAGMLPFAFFIPQSFWHTIKFRTNKLTTFSLIASITIIVFFMMAGTKLPNYTVPAYPFIAILIGNYLAWLVTKNKVQRLKTPVLLYALLILILPFGIYHGLKNDPNLQIPKSMLWLLMAPYLVLPILLSGYFRNKVWPVLLSMGSGFMILSLVFFWWAFPKVDQQNPVLIAKDLQHNMKEANLYYFKIFNPAFSFYLQRPIQDLQSDLKPQKAQGYLITRTRYLEELKAQGINYEPVFEGKDLFESPTTIIVKLLPDQ